MLQLSRMYLTVDDLDACQQQCVQLLKMDAENDDATGGKFIPCKKKSCRTSSSCGSMSG